MGKNDTNPNSTQQNKAPNPKSTDNTGISSASVIPGLGGGESGQTIPGLQTRQQVQQGNAGKITAYRALQQTVENQTPNNGGDSGQTNNGGNLPGADDYTPSGHYTDRRYGAEAGWDTRKLNDADYHNTKYDVGRYIGEHGVQRGNLQSLVDYFNSNYGGGFSVGTSDDDIKTPEGWNIDLINADGTPQWLVK